MTRLYILICLIVFSVCLTYGESESSVARSNHDVPQNKSQAVSDNLDIAGVPKDFVNLIVKYIKNVSNDSLYPGSEIETLETSKEIVRKIKMTYNNDAEGYFVNIVNFNNSPMLRTASYNIFLETDLNNGTMLNYARESLKERNWEDGHQLSIDISHQLRVLVAYGDESDLLLWDEIWDKMDEREQHSFKVYRKMLTKGLEKKNKIERAKAARGDKQAQQKLLDENSEGEELDPSVFENKQLIVMMIVLMILILGYIFLRKKNKS